MISRVLITCNAVSINWTATSNYVEAGFNKTTVRVAYYEPLGDQKMSFLICRPSTEPH